MKIETRTWTAVAALAGAAIAASQNAGATAPRPAVVELYTSQGCNSCPPADALLGELAKRSDVLALSFHVDYWDNLGWHDSFGLPQAVQRQSRYAQRLGLNSMYTPQMVIDGRDDVLGSDRLRVTQFLAAPRSGIAVAATVQGHELLVSLESKPGAPPCDVLLISFLPEADTAIGRGENAGRLLREFNVVRSIRTLGIWNSTAVQYHADLETLPRDARFIAVLVQEQASAAIVGAAHLPLPPVR